MKFELYRKVKKDGKRIIAYNIGKDYREQPYTSPKLEKFFWRKDENHESDLAIILGGRPPSNDFFYMQTERPVLKFMGRGHEKMVSVSQPMFSCGKDTGIKSILFGEYPQTVASSSVSSELENLFNKGKLKKSGKTYTFDKRYKNADFLGFTSKHFEKIEPLKFAEYQYNDGTKYIRIEARTRYEYLYVSKSCNPPKIDDERVKNVDSSYMKFLGLTSMSADEIKGYALIKSYSPSNRLLSYIFKIEKEKDFILSDNEHIEAGKIYWVKIEPIEWCNFALLLQ